MQLVPNPATGGAVWRARVEGADYAHELTLLRFPLTRLYAGGNALSLRHAGTHRGSAGDGSAARDGFHRAAAGGGSAVFRRQ